jgi:hypothetical protein
MSRMEGGRATRFDKGFQTAGNGDQVYRGGLVVTIAIVVVAMFKMWKLCLPK